MQGTLPYTLTELELRDFCIRVPVAEQQHLLRLRQLCSLTLHDVFDAPLSAAEQALLTPPTQSPLLPRLTKFSYHYQEAAV